MFASVAGLAGLGLAADAKNSFSEGKEAMSVTSFQNVLYFRAATSLEISFLLPEKALMLHLLKSKLIQKLYLKAP